ncbi:hypothetical protein OpiT1DRAFT_00589 [Opitutaceae bacterium TAV1]|nr:hypothetical protein OpiT1DRAFT_00589 [Opitutaceae bacterium TAV1]
MTGVSVFFLLRMLMRDRLPEDPPWLSPVSLLLYILIGIWTHRVFNKHIQVYYKKNKPA